MEKVRYMFVIEAEPGCNILIRVLTRIARQRIPVQELHTCQNESLQRFTITLFETKENAVRLSERINKEIEVHSVKILLTEVPVLDTSFNDIVVENSVALLHGPFKHTRLVQHAAGLLDKGKVNEAWQVLLRS